MGFPALVSKPVLDPRQGERQGLTKMTKDDLHVMPVEQPTENQPQRMRGGLHAEAPRRPQQPLIASVDPLLVGQRDAGVQIHRHAELLHGSPERFDRGFVEVLGGVLVTDVAVAVDQGSHEAEVVYGAPQFLGGLFRVLQGQRGERAQPVGVPGYEVFRGVIVHPAGHVDGLAGVGDAFNAGLGQRQDVDGDPIAVHILYPLVDLPQSPLNLGEVVGCGEVVAAGRREISGLPVLLQSDLADSWLGLHVNSTASKPAACLAPVVASRDGMKKPQAACIRGDTGAFVANDSILACHPPRLMSPWCGMCHSTRLRSLNLRRTSSAGGSAMLEACGIPVSVVVCAFGYAVQTAHQHHTNADGTWARCISVQ